MNIVDIASFSLVILALILTGVYKSRKILDEEGYLFANRTSGIFALVATLVMTEFNTSTLISFSGLGFLTGAKALILPVIFLIGLLFYTFVVAKKWKESNVSSVSEIFSRRYHPLLGKLVSICLLLSMLGFNATYIKSLSMIFEPMLKIGSFSMGLVIVVLTLAMTLRGGLFSIIKTDIVSFSLLLVCLPLILFFSMKGLDKETFFNMFSVAEYQLSSKMLPTSFIISLIVLTMFTYILAPWYGQKIFSAKTTTTAFIATFISAFLVFILYFICTLSTLSLKAKGLNVSNHELSYPYILTHNLPIFFKGVCLATIFSATATTLSGAWSAMSSMVINDFLKLNPKLNYKRSLSITFVFALTSFILSQTLVDQILNKLILSNIPVAALCFALLGAFYMKKATTLGAVLSIFFGLFWGIFCYFFYGEKNMYTWPWAMYGIPLTFAIGISFSLLSYKRKTASN